MLRCYFNIASIVIFTDFNLHYYINIRMIHEHHFHLQLLHGIMEYYSICKCHKFTVFEQLQLRHRSSYMLEISCALQRAGQTQPLAGINTGHWP